MVIMVMRLIRLKMDNSELWSDIGQSHIIRLKIDNSELWSDIGQSHIIRLKIDDSELWSLVLTEKAYLTCLLNFLNLLLLFIKKQKIYLL